MKFLIRPQAPVFVRMSYGDVEYGFRKDRMGQIFFLATHGRETISFPVLEDGTISPHGDFGTFPETVVDLVHPKELGISEIQWAKS